jgi:hypothetical protein
MQTYQQELLKAIPYLGYIQKKALTKYAYSFRK